MEVEIVADLRFSSTSKADRSIADEQLSIEGELLTVFRILPAPSVFPG